jgi:hypothetical protein
MKQFIPMLIRHARPMESPVCKGAAQEHDDRIRKDDAPIGKDVPAEVIPE